MMAECLCRGDQGYEVGTFEGKTHWVRCLSCGARTPALPDFQNTMDSWQRMQTLPVVKAKD